MNQNQTEDRANLTLIICFPNTKIEKDGQLLIDLGKVEKKIDYSDNNIGY